MRHPRKGGVLLEMLLILGGLALIVKGAMLGAADYKFIHLADHAEGVVTGTGAYGLSVNVQFPADHGTLYVFEQTGLFPKTQVGDAASVLYDPANPNYAMVDRMTAIWSVPAMLVLPGLGLLLVGLKLRGSRNL